MFHAQILEEGLKIGGATYEEYEEFQILVDSLDPKSWLCVFSDSLILGQGSPPTLPPRLDPTQVGLATELVQEARVLTMHSFLSQRMHGSS